jgi:hypothetical protein
VRRSAICCVALTLLFLCATREARAHDETVSTSTVRITDREVLWKVDVGMAGLAKVVPLPVAQGRLRAEDLAIVRAPIAAALERGLGLRVERKDLHPVAAALAPVWEPSLEGPGDSLTRVTQTFVFTSPIPITTVTLQVRFFSELTQRHRAVVRVFWNDRIRTVVQSGPGEITLAPDEMERPSTALVREFFPWGLEHIFLGYDHIAFLIALLLGVTRPRDVIAVVTSFTIAHSLTLMLSAADVVRISPRVSEPLIAASIVYVACENFGWRFLRPTAGHRWLVTFIFGLVHGLGFASEVRSTVTELGGHVVIPVLAFNAGVEVGQLGIVALIWPLLARLRRGANALDTAARQRRLCRMGSVPILLLGLFWLAERLLK